MDAQPHPPHLDLRVMGTTMRVDLSHAWLSAEDHQWLRDIWSRAAIDDDSTPVSLESPSLTHARTLSSLASSASSAVTLAALRRQAGKLLMLHAAGLAEPETGRTIAFVAQSGTGKTTAAAALGRHWGYVSDETVAIDPSDLRVHPHPKPLSVGQAGKVKEQVGPDGLGLGATPEAPTLARIVLLARNPEHEGSPRIEPVGLARAIGEITPETSYLTHWKTPLAMMARVLNASGGVVRVNYRDAEDLAPIVQSLLSEARHEEQWRALPDPRVADSLATDDELVVMTADESAHVVVLAGIAPLVWRELGRDGVTTTELLDALVAAYGEPPDGDARRALDACLATLAERGLSPRGIHDG